MPTKSKPNFVLDAWAVLALIQGEEPAAARVLEVLDLAERGFCGLQMCWINVGEVYYTLRRRVGEVKADQALADIRLLPVHFREASEDLVLEAARHKAGNRISYADAFAVATALGGEATLLTGDPEILALAGLVPVEPLSRNQP